MSVAVLRHPRALAVAVALAVALVSGACGDGEGTPSTSGAGASTEPLLAPPPPVATSGPASATLVVDTARATVAAGIARFAGQSIDVVGGRAIVKGYSEGHVDLGVPRGFRRDWIGENLLDGRYVVGRPGQLVALSEVWLDGRHSVERSPRWPGSADPGQMSLAEFLGLGSSQEGTPEESLVIFFEGHTFEVVGSEEVRGGATTRYHSEREDELDDVDLWVDAAGRMTRVLRWGRVEAGGPTTMLVLELYGFGVPGEIPPPPS